LKHQYFGDINDYRKYGLIRTLCGSGLLSTYICWMLTLDSKGNKDGKKISYLSHQEVWRHYDSDLFDFLQTEILQQKTSRIIDERALSNVLPNARFFTPLLQDAADLRDEYFKTLFHELPRTGGLLFLDPDNGLEVPSCRKGNKNSSKYVYWGEVNKAYESGHSVLIYQHFQRVERKKYIRDISEKANAKTGATVFAYVTSHVVFFLLARPEHIDHFKKANVQLSRQWHTQILIASIEEQHPNIEPDCPFCNPDNSKVVLVNAHSIAVYDSYPVTPGHTLIVPKRHIASFFEATKEELAAMFDLLAEMRERLKSLPASLSEREEENPHQPPFDKMRSLSVPDGFNIGINDGTAAGQTVMHLHIHLIPRYAGDTEDPRGGVRWIMPKKAQYWETL
jgi:diadenosine tetraphosphate (Ap4A) HIT family hydrolase